MVAYPPLVIDAAGKTLTLPAGATLRDAGGAEFSGAAALHAIRRIGANSKGSTNTNIVRFATARYSVGTITHNDASAATDGSIFTIGIAGYYTLSTTVCGDVAGANVTIMAHASAATNTFTEANILAGATVPNVQFVTNIDTMAYLTAGTKVWVHYGNAVTDLSADEYTSVTIALLQPGQIGGGLIWNETTGTSASLVKGNGYFANNASRVTYTLPTTAALGDEFEVDGKGAGGWKIAQNANQVIHTTMGDSATGTGGYLESTHRYDCARLRCIAANTDFLLVHSIGSLTVNQ